MNKKIAITAITLVAVSLGIAAMGPAVYAEPPNNQQRCDAIDRITLQLTNLLLGFDSPLSQEAKLKIAGALTTIQETVAEECYQ